MFNSIRIRTKLAFALLIPMLALVASSSLVISAANSRAADAQAEADTTSEQVALATAALGPSGILAALNNERTAESLALIGLDPKIMGPTSQAETRQATDQAIDQFRAAVSAKPKAVRDTYQASIDGLAQLGEFRARSDASTDRSMGNATATASYDAYASLVNAVFDANTRAALAVDNAELRSGVRYIDRLTRYKDVVSVLQRVIGGAVTFSHVDRLTDDPTSLKDAAGIVRLSKELRGEMEKVDSPFYAEQAEALFTEPSVAAATKMQDDAMAGLPIVLGDLIGPITQESTTKFTKYLDQASARLQSDADRIRGAAEAEAAEAARQARLVTGITSAVLILAVAVTVAASRSITRPLSRLVGAAEDMATRTLPATVTEILETPMGQDIEVPELAEIDDRGGYEIAEVASALNTVQASAADLAVEQAVLRRNIADAFVNLGRRNQNLLTRLLETITEMERNEADPDQLQELFSLDSLATRMRRNAESLVVLAGVDTRRQWSAPIPVIDLVRGALGEVEDFQRAEIVELDEAVVDGAAIADVTHLVAELLENALTHSPPNRPVEIRGRAHAEGYRLSIVDHGVGMEPDELAVANTRLSGGESFTVAPSRYLGHYVVGRQASRLGLGVELRNTPGGGATAWVEIGPVVAPADAITEAPEEEFEAAPEEAPIEAPAAAAPVPAAPIPGPLPEPEPPRPVLDGRFAHRSLATGDHLMTSQPAPAAETNVSTSADADRPATLAEALGQDHTEAVTPENAMGDAAEPATTTSGYARRVKGTHTPNTEVRTARPDNAPRRSSGGAEGMRSALNSMQAGMRRSWSDEDDETTDSNTEEAQ